MPHLVPFQKIPLEEIEALVRRWVRYEAEDRSALLMGKRPTPFDPPRTLGIGLRKGTRGGGGSYKRGTPVSAPAPR